MVAQFRPTAAPFSADKLLDVRIELDPAAWQKLRTGHRDTSRMTVSPFEYCKASVEIDGTKFNSVGLRKKGFFGSVVS